MESLRDRVQADYRQAMKARDERAVSAYRMLLARVKNTEIERRVEALSDDDFLEVVGKEVKQRQAALEELRRANRPDVVAREEEELVLLQGYLPVMMTEDEVRAVVRDVIARTGAASKSGIGVVMKEAMAQVRGRSDGKLVNRIAAEELG